MPIAQTSILSYKKVKDDLKGQHYLIWWFILCNPNLCDRQIAERMKIYKNVINARRNELVTKKAVYCSGFTKDPKTNMTVMTWASNEVYPQGDEQLNMMYK